MGVIIGMDPHKRSATIEVIDQTRATVWRWGGSARTRPATPTMLAAGPAGTRERVWAVEGCNGIGKHIAHRLVHDGEVVVDVPPKLSAQVRVFATGNGRKTDPVDAHSVALAALYAPADPGLRRVTVDDDLVVMGLLVDRRDELGRARTQTINRLHRLLLELFPGRRQAVPVRAAGPGADRHHQAAGPGRQDPAPARGRADHRARGHRPQDQDRRERPGGARHRARLDPDGADRDRPTGAARLLADVGDIHRFRDKDRFASWNGTAPLDASSGAQQRHRLSRAGQPADQPDAAHHGRRPAAQPHPGAGVLRRPQGRRHTLDDGHAVPQAAPVQRRVRPHARRPEPTRPRCRRRAREGTWATTLTPARPAHSPTPALRTSHFPDPPPTSLEPLSPRCLDLKGCHERTSDIAYSPSWKTRWRRH